LTLLASWAKTGADFQAWPLTLCNFSMPVRSALKILLAIVLGLPVVYCVLAGVSSLLVSMGDAAGAGMVGRVQSVCLVTWSVGLVGLVILSAVVVIGLLPDVDEDDGR